MKKVLVRYPISPETDKLVQGHVIEGLGDVDLLTEYNLGASARVMQICITGKEPVERFNHLAGSFSPQEKSLFKLASHTAQGHAEATNPLYHYARVALSLGLRSFVFEFKGEGQAGFIEWLRTQVEISMKFQDPAKLSQYDFLLKRGRAWSLVQLRLFSPELLALDQKYLRDPECYFAAPQSFNISETALHSDEPQAAKRQACAILQNRHRPNV